MRQFFASVVERVFAGILLVVLSPVILLIALIILIVDLQNPFFLQVRVGKNGVPFRMLKFRTLRTIYEPYSLKPPDDDPVITRAGKIFRVRGIDELPQLWNVVMGQMALVGPRPEMQFIVDKYTPIERMRLGVRPGLTGLWQLSRVRDRAIHHHIEYDLFYINNRTIGLNLWLLWRTFLFALFRTATKIRLAVARWERRKEWRRLAPAPAAAIPPRSAPLLSTIWGAFAAAVILLMVVPAVVTALGVQQELKSARTSMETAEKAFRRFERRSAAAALADASGYLDRAEQKLDSPLLAPARRLPLIRENLSTTMTLVEAGRAVVEAGEEARKVFGELPVARARLAVPIHDGQVDLDPLTKSRAPAQKMFRLVAGAERSLRATSPDLLLPALARARTEGLSMLRKAGHQADVAVATSSLLPRLLGAEGPRSIILGAENLSELRGRGGYIGSVGIVRSEAGTMALSDFTPIERLPPLPLEINGPVAPEYRGHLQDLGALDAWQNLGMSPHFPSGAAILLEQLATNANIQGDSLVSLDPVALSYLVDATGPIVVPGLPEPLTSENIAPWALNRIYFEYTDDNEARRQVLAQISSAVWQRLMSGAELDPGKVGRALGRALSERHMVLFSTVPEEQALIERLGIAGEVEATPGDYLLVVGQNLGENKMDYYMKRRIDYEGKLRPDGSMDARVQVTMTNTASPAAALPDYVGGSRPRLYLEQGESRTYLSMYVPARAIVRRVLKDGAPVEAVDTGVEIGKRYVGADVTLNTGQSQRLTFEYTIPNVMQGTRYTLTLQNQALFDPDRVSARISPPRHFEVESRAGFSRGELLSWEGRLVSDRQMTAKIKLPVQARFRDAMVALLQRPVLRLI